MTTASPPFLSCHSSFRLTVRSMTAGRYSHNKLKTFALFSLQVRQTPFYKPGERKLKPNSPTVSYQQGVTASHDAQTQARVAFGDLNGGLTAGDDGTGRGVAGQSGRGGRAAETCNRGSVV